MLNYIIIIVAGYLLGSINMGVLVSKIGFLDDVRGHGSGNAGATNMARVFGMGAGFITLLGDMLKAVIAMLIGKWLMGDLGLAIGGVACIVGHCLPVFFHFKGGKGVAVAVAVALMTHFYCLLAFGVVFFALALTTKKVSVGSVCAAIALPITAAILSVSTPKLLLCIAAMLTVLWQHRPNIRRIFNNTEPDFKPAHRNKKL